MQNYLRKRGHIWSVAATVGTLFSTVWFAAYLDEIRNYFKIGVFGRHQFPCLLATFTVPILVAYVGLYLLNQLLICFYCVEDLQDRRRKLLIDLVDAYVFRRKVLYRADDLVDEYAWTSIKPLWRNK